MENNNRIIEIGRMTLNEPVVKIPGTTYSLQFGTEGKYYAVSLIHGRQKVHSKQLDILKGTALDNLSEELENGMKFLLESENLYISPVIVDRVVNEILEQVPEEGEMETKKEQQDEKRLVPENINVQELIKKSENRAEKKSIIEHKPAQKPKYDASAEGIGKISLPKPKPLPKKETMVERAETPSETTAKPKPKPMEVEKQKTSENYEQMQSKIESLTNEMKGLEETITKNKNQITSLKRQITILKNKLKEISE